MVAKNMMKLFAVSLSLAFLAQPAQALAWDRGHHYPSRSRYYVHHHYPSYGRVSVVLPFGSTTVVLSGSKYYYSRGVYYNRRGPRYVVVPPPAGIVVAGLPAGCQPVVVNGATYYTNGGVYYQYTPSGYVVVPQPTSQTVYVQPPAPQVIDNNIEVAGIYSGKQESYRVNVPNLSGGYNAVILKRSGEGFVGPQGEFYPDFPRIEELQTAYGH